MMKYGKIAPEFWVGETGRALRSIGAEVQLLALYLITGPNSNMYGLYSLPVVLVAHHLGMTTEGASKALARASEGGFCQYDESAEMVFVPNAAYYQIGESITITDKRHTGIVTFLHTMRKCRYADDFYQKYSEMYNLKEYQFKIFGEAPCKPLASPLQAPTKPTTTTTTTAATTTPTIKTSAADEPPKRRRKHPVPLWSKELSPIPANLDKSEFNAEWLRWLAFRADEKRIPVTLTAGQEQLAMLSRYTIPQAIEIIKASIRGGYQGLFEPKGNGKPQQQNTQWYDPMPGESK